MDGGWLQRIVGDGLQAHPDQILLRLRRSFGYFHLRRRLDQTATRHRSDGICRRASRQIGICQRDALIIHLTFGTIRRCRSLVGQIGAALAAGGQKQGQKG